MASPFLPDRSTRAYAGTNCVVTGGLGFIGSNLTLALTEAGARVSVIDSLEVRHGGDIRNIEGADPHVVIDDIANAARFSEILVDADYVFNLAGQVSHADSMEDPVHDFDVNARSQVAFLEAMRRVDSGATVVYASTRQVYGRPRYLPVDEGHPVRPVDVNGISKLAAERMHDLYHEVYGTPVRVLRFSNVYGPRQRLDGDHQGFLPVFVRRSLQGEPIVLFGDGSQERDCLYVDEAVDALLASAATPEAAGQTFNIGHPECFSLREIAETLFEATGMGEIQTIPWPRAEERISIGSYRTDIRKAESILGWRPTIDLAEGMERTLAHYRSHARWANAAAEV